MEASANTMREYENLLVKVRQEELQPLQLLLVEDILRGEFNFELEDFKHTVMHHKLLEDQIMVR